MVTNDIIGISFPILPKHVERILEMENVVFIKFTPHESLPKHLKAGMNLYFYESHANKEIVGEAKISVIELMPAIEVQEKYSDELFITDGDFREYIKGREEKKILVLVLSEIKSYTKPIAFEKPINMGGKYIRARDLKGAKL